MTMRVGIQERQRLFREGLAILLEGEPDITVVGTAHDPTQLVALCADHDPDVVIVAFDDDPTEILDAAALVRHRGDIRVLGVCDHADEATAATAFSAGVEAVIAREAGVVPVLNALRNPSSRRLVAPAQPAGSARRPKQAELTPRELEVLRHVSGGLTTQGVADALGISRKTVENHKQRVFQKLGVQNQAHAVATALRLGLLQPGDSTRAEGL